MIVSMYSKDHAGNSEMSDAQACPKQQKVLNREGGRGGRKEVTLRESSQLLTIIFNTNKNFFGNKFDN